MSTTVAIDLNVRVRGQQTFAGFEDVVGPISVGDAVEVHEDESGLRGPGRVVEIDAERQLIYLTVEWSKLAERTAGPQPHADEVLMPSHTEMTRSFSNRPQGTVLRLGAGFVPRSVNQIVDDTPLLPMVAQL